MLRTIPSLFAVLTSVFVLTSCAGNSNQTPTMAMVNNQQIAPPVGLMLVSLDDDRDTIVTAEEIDAALPAMFEAFDSDASGALTGLEFSDWSMKHLGSRHSVPGRLRFDLNQNSRITLEEFETTIDAMVMRFDQDNDGALARHELLVTLSGPDMAAMRAQMEGQMRSRARQMCQQAMRRGR